MVEEREFQYIATNLWFTIKIGPLFSSSGKQVDWGDRWSRYCVLDRSGEVIEEDRIRTTESGIEAWVSGIPATRIVIEAGTHSPWVRRQLTGYGHEVVVANARKVWLIYESDGASAIQYC